MITLAGFILAFQYVQVDMKDGCASVHSPDAKALNALYTLADYTMCGRSGNVYRFKPKPGVRKSWTQRLRIDVNCHEKAFEGAHTPLTTSLLHKIADALAHGVQMTKYPFNVMENEREDAAILATVNLIETVVMYQVKGTWRKLGAIGHAEPFTIHVSGFFDTAHAAREHLRDEYCDRFQDIHIESAEYVGVSVEVAS